MFGISTSGATTAPSSSDNATPSSSIPPNPTAYSGNPTRRKRRPAGTPDPDAEMVALSPRTLMESDRYVCDICGQGFHRDQNLQMHRRRHKVPWKLAKKEGAESAAARKRAFVCPEPSCLHHDPAHALGDLVGIRKHYRRKHSDRREWECARCCKAYAVHSDYKAHLKTCGTRGHSCDCGRVFSRAESFIEHQDTCINASRVHGADPQTPQSAGSLRPTSTPTTPNDDNFIGVPAAAASRPWPMSLTFSHNLELQLLPSPIPYPPTTPACNDTRLKLSIGSMDMNQELPPRSSDTSMNERAMAEEARRQSKIDVEQAENEFANAIRFRQQARAELQRAYTLRQKAAAQINSILVDITCHDCRQHLVTPADGAETAPQGGSPNKISKT